tara:strand:+ start:31 stop:579 length:549 start_codon:yes stop_codon:yes gene_type:complete
MIGRRTKNKKHVKHVGQEIPLRNTDSFIVFTVLAYFASFFYIIELFPSLDLSIFQLFQFFSLFLGLSFIIPIKIYRKFFALSFYEYLLFNILSFSPVLIMGTFILNTNFKGATYIESYKIENRERLEYQTIYTLEENAYQDKEYLRSIGEKEEVEIRGNENLAIYFSNGLFGIRIIEKKRVY